MMRAGKNARAPRAAVFPAPAFAAATLSKCIKKDDFARAIHFYPHKFRVIYLLEMVTPLYFILRSLCAVEVDYKEIGQNIRRYRMAKGWKQKQLAEKISMTEQHISHIENAHTQLSLPTLIAIANALEIDCNTLLGKTLRGAETSVLRGEFDGLLANMERDPKKMRLCVQVCQLLTQSEL